MAPYSRCLTPGEATAGSPAHLIDARVKVLLTGILSFAVWGIDSFTGLGITGVLVGCWVILTRGALRAILSSLRKLVYIFLAVIIYYCWAEASRPGMNLLQGFDSALAKSLLLTGKLALLIAAAFWLYLTTEPMKVVDALTSLLRPLERLRLPVREFAFVVGLIVRFFPASLTRIKDLHRNFQLKENLRFQKTGSGNRYARVLMRVIDTMVLYMHYSLYEAQLLSLSLMSRGYNPFRPLSLAVAEKLTLRDFSFFTISATGIILTAWWL
jgi:energy-coupling factor transport system permease protein